MIHEPPGQITQQRQSNKHDQHCRQIRPSIVWPACHVAVPIEWHKSTPAVLTTGVLKESIHSSMTKPSADDFRIGFRCSIARWIEPFVFEFDSLLLLHREVRGQSHDRIGHRDSAIAP